MEADASTEFYLAELRPQRSLPLKGFAIVMASLGGGSFLNGHTTVVSYGGGVDYNLSPRWVVRAGDFEFLQWFITPRRHPYDGSVGVAYEIFR